MIDKAELKLLTAILNAISESNINTFNSLREKLKKADILDLDDLSKLVYLNIANNKAPKTTTSKSIIKTNYGDAIRKYMLNLDKKDPIKARALKDTITAIRSKQTIKSLSTFKDFLITNNISTKNIKSWDEGIYLLIHTSLNKETADIENVISQLNSLSTDDRSLDSWSNIIFDKKKKPI